MIALAIAAALTAAMSAAPAEPLPTKLAPIDQCSGDEGFTTFRETLASATAREDSQSLSGLLAPDLRPTPGGRSAEDYWPQLEILLRMGCVRSGAARIMPSAPQQLQRFGPESLKGKYLALPGADLLETTEDPNSVVDGAVLKWDIVTATNIAGDFWTGVKLNDGRRGWIVDADLYSLEYPSWIRVEQRDGQWMITKFE